MKLTLRREKPPVLVPVQAGEKVLAWCETGDGRVAAGTRDAFHLVGSADEEPVRVPWEQVESADWDGETSTLRLVEVGTWGQPRAAHELEVTEPRRLPELIRERVTASIVLQRHVAVRGRRGVRVIARRAPRGDAPLFWVYEFDEGIDPEDPRVRGLAEAELLRMQDEVGVA